VFEELEALRERTRDGESADDEEPPLH